MEETLLPSNIDGYLSTAIDAINHRDIRQQFAYDLVTYLEQTRDRFSLVSVYPRLQRVVKAVTLCKPEIYPNIRLQLEQILEGSETDDNLRIIRQARAIDCLLEATQLNFRASPFDNSDRRYPILKKSLSSVFPRTSHVFGILARGDKPNSTYYLEGSLLPYITSRREYLETGWNSQSVYQQLLLDLALSASGIYEEWHGAFSPHQAFDQALLHFLKKTRRFADIVFSRIKKSLATGIITPPPLSLTMRGLLKELYPDFNPESSDPQYFFSVLSGFWKDHRDNVIQAVEDNFVYVTSYNPEEYFRYQRLFERLKEVMGKGEVKNILEMGVSTFGAALGLKHFFPDSHILGCDLLPYDKQLARCSDDVRQKIQQQAGFSYLTWDITRGIPFAVTQALGSINEQFDIVTLLNSAYPHCASTVRLSDGKPDSTRGRVAALESVIRASSKVAAIAGGFGMHTYFSAENPHEMRPTTHGNAWIFSKRNGGGLSCEGILYT